MSELHPGRGGGRWLSVAAAAASLCREKNALSFHSDFDVARKPHPLMADLSVIKTIFLSIFTYSFGLFLNSVYFGAGKK